MKKVPAIPYLGYFLRFFYNYFYGIHKKITDQDSRYLPKSPDLGPYPRCQKGVAWSALSWGEGIRFWRTADGKAVDFVLPEIDVPIALESNFDFS